MEIKAGQSKQGTPASSAGQHPGNPGRPKGRSPRCQRSRPGQSGAPVWATGPPFEAKGQAGRQPATQPTEKPVRHKQHPHQHPDCSGQNPSNPDFAKFKSKTPHSYSYLWTNAAAPSPAPATSRLQSRKADLPAAAKLPQVRIEPQSSWSLSKFDTVLGEGVSVVRRFHTESIPPTSKLARLPVSSWKQQRGVGCSPTKPGTAQAKRGLQLTCNTLKPSTSTWHILCNIRVCDTTPMLAVYIHLPTIDRRRYPAFEICSLI